MLRILTKDAAAETEALTEGLMVGSEPWELGGLGSSGSEPSLLPEEEGTSMGRQEAEEGRKVPLRTGADAGLVSPQWTEAEGGELPADGADTVLRSNRSVTDTDSSPGLQQEEKQSDGRTMGSSMQTSALTQIFA